MASKARLLILIGLAGCIHAYIHAPLALRSPALAVRAHTRRPTNSLSLLRAQQNPHNMNPKDSKSSFQVLFGSLKDAVSQFGSGKLKEEEGSQVDLRSLLTIPLWVGLIVGALFLPSPDMVEAAIGPFGDIFEGAKNAVTTAEIPGLNTGGLSLQQLANPKLDPSLFVPVCGFSDSFYRTAKNAVFALAGKETYEEYAPLIAGSLLRVRLEFCVLESFVYESIIPFIKARGLSWVFPIKETLETFVAGVVFAVASNLVLIGSTKIITILISYLDFFIGLPLRLIFGFVTDRLVEFKANQNPVGSAILFGTSVAKFVGQTSGVARQFIEGADIFVGRYLLLTTVGYVILKFLKFKGVLTLDTLAAAIQGMLNVVQTTPPPT